MNEVLFSLSLFLSLLEQSSKRLQGWTAAEIDKEVRGVGQKAEKIQCVVESITKFYPSYAISCHYGEFQKFRFWILAPDSVVRRQRGIEPQAPT